jgi:hypothetical protein
MRTLTLVGAALVLAGCATDRLQAELQTYVSTDIRDFIARMGYPDSTHDVLGDTVYVWTTNRAGAIPVTTANNGTTFVPISRRCTVQVITDGAGTIKLFTWEGNESGCKRYARRLRR